MLQSFAESAGGDPTEGAGTWLDVTTLWAQKMSKAVAERFVNAAELAEADAVFRIRWREGIEPTNRILDGTDAWNVIGIVEVETHRRRDEMFVQVTRIVPRDRVDAVAVDADGLRWGETLLQWGSGPLDWGA